MSHTTRPDSVVSTFLVSNLADLQREFQQQVPETIRSELAGVVAISHSFAKEDAQVLHFLAPLQCPCYFVKTAGTIGWHAQLGLNVEAEQVGRGKELGGAGASRGAAAFVVVAVRKPPVNGHERSWLDLRADGAPGPAEGAVGHLVICSMSSQALGVAFLTDKAAHAPCAGGFALDAHQLMDGQRWERISFIALTAMNGEECVFSVAAHGALNPLPVTAGDGREMLSTLPAGYKPELVGIFICWLRGQNMYDTCHFECENMEATMGQTVPAIGYVAGGEIGPLTIAGENPSPWGHKGEYTASLILGASTMCCFAVRDKERQGFTPEHRLANPYEKLRVKPAPGVWGKESVTVGDLVPTEKPSFWKQVASWLSLPQCCCAESEKDFGIENTSFPPAHAEIAERTSSLRVDTTAADFRNVLRGIPLDRCSFVKGVACSFWVPGEVPNKEMYMMSFPVEEVDVFISQVIRPPEGMDAHLFALMKALVVHGGSLEIAVNMIEGSDEVHDQMQRLTFWVDRACVNQDHDAEKMRIIKDHLEDFLVNAKYVLCILSPHYFTRLWCIFEFCCALAERKDPKTIVVGAAGMPWLLPVGAQLVDSIVNMSVATAQCYDLADRHIIESKITANYVSMDHFQEFAKLSALGLLAKGTLAFIMELNFMDTWQLWIDGAGKCGFQELQDALKSFDLQATRQAVYDQMPDSPDETQSWRRLRYFNQHIVDKWFDDKVAPLIMRARDCAVKSRAALLQISVSSCNIGRSSSVSVHGGA